MMRTSRSLMALVAIGVVATLVGGCTATSEDRSDPGPSSDTTSTSEDITTTLPTEMPTIEVAFSLADGDCSDVMVFDRQAETALEPISAAFDMLVAGPVDAEREQGADSFFSADTAGTVASTTIDGGLLVVDFDDLRSIIPNASTSCGSMALLAQLNTAAFQFDHVERVRYEIEGSCDSFGHWLQRECTEYTREGAQTAQS